MHMQWIIRTTVVAAFVLAGCAGPVRDTRQVRVHHRAPQVMPFDMAKTVHIFRMTEFGGVQSVIVRDPQDIGQIVLIRRHLRHEAERFQKGDFGDPARLHGSHMPGLAELQAGAAHMTVSYAPLPDGARITYRTTDLHLLTALHRWFGAQLSEHGADARAE